MEIFESQLPATPTAPQLARGFLRSTLETWKLDGFGEITEQTPVSVKLKVPRARVTETCRQLLDACDVSDINVQEVPVEDVIRQLFGERRDAHSSADLAAKEVAQVS